MKFLFEDEESIFSLVEEKDFFRLKVERQEIGEEHVEEFMDKTVEWLSSNPEKGILIDFRGVTFVCADFAVALQRYYQDIKKRGIYVRFVNVDPVIEPYIDASNITVVMTLPEKPRVSARELLDDLANHLTDEELMRKYDLSPKGLSSMFRKMLRRGLISRRTLAKRMGVRTREVTVVLEGRESSKVTLDASEVMKDLAEGVNNKQLMEKYKLSVKGLHSLFTKLFKAGLISKGTLLTRKRLSE